MTKFANYLKASLNTKHSIYFQILIPLLLAAAAIAFYHIKYTSVSDFSSLEAVTEMPAVKSKVLLIPLDSRPPCGQLVKDSGRTAGVEVNLPPTTIMDYYSQPGDTKALGKWVQDNISGSEAAILSIDQLLYGGLLASREGQLKSDAIPKLMEYLRQLHKANPKVPLYVFSVLPRMNPVDSIDTRVHRKLLMEYSRLLDRQAIIYEKSMFTDAEALRELNTKIADIEAQLPPDVLSKYTSLFENNAHLHQELSKLAQEGIIAQLVIAQDDGERYSLPNLKLRQLKAYLAANNIPEEKVFITRGADEVALAMLARHISTKACFKPHFFVEYNAPETSTDIAPYMAVPASESASEKLRYLGLAPADEADGADAILFISYGQSSTLNQRKECAEHIKSYLDDGRPVALVDTSRHFAADETIFPQLLNIDAPINALTAYAGWNTVSNSVGTALSQAVIYIAARNAAHTQQELSSIEKSHIQNLSNRFLEDYYYLKDVIDIANAALKRKGYTNVNDLDLEHNYQWLVQDLQTAMNERAYQLKMSQAYRQPYNKLIPSSIYCNATADNNSSVHSISELHYQVRDLHTDVSFPWPRTFEIAVNSTTLLYRIK